MYDSFSSPVGDVVFFEENLWHIRPSIQWIRCAVCRAKVDRGVKLIILLHMLRGDLLPQPQQVIVSWEAFHIVLLRLFLLQPKLYIVSAVAIGDGIRSGSLPSLRPLILIRESRRWQTTPLDPSHLCSTCGNASTHTVAIMSSHYVPGGTARVPDAMKWA
jgi:hypothetical protein